MSRSGLVEAVPHPVWWDGREVSPTSDPLVGHATADLVIVGGGLTGLWAAIEAADAEPGRRIVVLEQGIVASGASGRNGGFISDSLTHGLTHGVSQWPDEIETLVRLGRENLQAIVDFVDREGIDADLRLCGKTMLATRPHEVAALQNLAALHRRFGDDATFLDQTAARADVGSPTYLAGVRLRIGGLLHPVALTCGLRDAALARGVVLHERSRAIDLATGAAGAVVRTESGSVLAAQALLATNAFEPLLKRLRLMVVPVWDHVIATEPLSTDQIAAIGWSENQGLTDAGNQFHYYRRTPDDRILFGGYDANYYYGSSRSADLEHGPSHLLLERHLRETFPQLEDVAVTHAWGGMIDTTTRFNAFTGVARQGRIGYALGFTGLGVAASRFAALTVLDQLAGRETERTSLRMTQRKPLPFPPEPVRWTGVQLTRAAMAREDRTGRRGALLRTLDKFGVGFDS